MKRLVKNYILYIAFIQSLAATLISLFFSEVLHVIPCPLCWYQRIFMYPLVVIFAVGIIRKDKSLYLYALPLSILGTLIALYHNLLYYGIVPEQIAPCTPTVPCIVKARFIFDFMTIPLASFLAFMVINISLVFYWKLNKK